MSMWSQRLILAIAMLAALVVVGQCWDGLIGIHQNDERLFEVELIQKPAEPGKTATAEYTCTPEDGKKVVAVELVDRNDDKTVTGFMYSDGGIGKTYLSIIFYSKINYGIDYEAKCYATLK